MGNGLDKCSHGDLQKSCLGWDGSDYRTASFRGVFLAPQNGFRTVSPDVGQSYRRCGEDRSDAEFASVRLSPREPSRALLRQFQTNLYLTVMARGFGYLVVAGAAAVALAKLTHTELGLSPTLIRDAALLCSGMLCIGLYSSRFGGRK